MAAGAPHGPPPRDPTTGRAATRRQLLETLPRQSVGAELGVWRGDFSAFALELVAPARLHLVDPWRFSRDPRLSSALYGGLVARSQADMDVIYQQVLARFDHEIRTGVVQVHRARSDEAAARFEDSSFDWVYVDGDHSYDGILDDLGRYWPKVRPGGRLCGDDYTHVTAWWGDGVKRAVEDFGSRECLAVDLRVDQWEILKPLI
jgi:hypothetical protein